MNAQKRAAIFSQLRAANPSPQTELAFASPFQLLVAVVLSAQATDRSVNLATANLFAAAPTAQDMAELGAIRIESYIKSIGLFRTKAKHVAELSRILVADHGGKVPASREALEALPGVGRKTANVVLNVAFGQCTIAVDTHIFRISNRTGIAPGRNVVEVEHRLLKLVPKPYLLHAHHWLILHGRYVCKARTPECWRCMISTWCEYRPQSLAPQRDAAALINKSNVLGDTKPERGVKRKVV